MAGSTKPAPSDPCNRLLLILIESKSDESEGGKCRKPYTFSFWLLIMSFAVPTNKLLEKVKSLTDLSTNTMLPRLSCKTLFAM